MNKRLFLILIFGLYAAYACQKDEYSDRFLKLTTPVWTSDSLLVNGVDAGGPGALLEKFKGDAKFNKNGTGYFGKFTGSWLFAGNETELVIYSDSLPVPSLTTKIAELNDSSLKITTGFPNLLNPSEDYKLRMTFKVK